MIESYRDADGCWHWPDAVLGDEVERYVDWDDWLVNENDTLVDVTWTVPTGLTEMTTREVGNQAIIKVSADSVGTFLIACTINSEDASVTQKKTQRVSLTVK